MKPWLDKWWVAGETDDRVYAKDTDSVFLMGAARPFYADGNTDVDAHAKAVLVAAAPQLVRALLMAEFTVSKGYCQGCNAGPWVHEPDCSVDAALTASGLPDRASRDAARDDIDAMHAKAIQ